MKGTEGGDVAVTIILTHFHVMLYLNTSTFIITDRVVMLLILSSGGLCKLTKPLAPSIILFWGSHMSFSEKSEDGGGGSGDQMDLFPPKRCGAK